ncbi:hypothetical protein Hanom_Chr05g00466481 [Helianthus anomalus]
MMQIKDHHGELYRRGYRPGSHWQLEASTSQIPVACYVEIMRKLAIICLCLVSSPNRYG